MNLERIATVQRCRQIPAGIWGIPRLVTFLVKTETLERIVNELSSKEFEGIALLWRLSETVDFAKVWLGEPECGDTLDRGCDIYLIRHEGQYIGAIYDMVDDLHVFLKEGFRKRGHMVDAVSDTVFPWLLQQKQRETQRVTYEDPGMEDYLERHWQFEIKGDGSASGDLSKYNGHPIIQPRALQDSANLKAAIEARVAHAKQQLVIASELLRLEPINEALKTQLDGTIRAVDRLGDSIVDHLW